MQEQQVEGTSDSFGLKQGDGIPLYVRLASLFRDRIVSGAWPVGKQIGTLPTLQAEYGVARATVQQAVRILSEEGLLSSERGRGTFVIKASSSERKEPKPSYDLLELDARFSIKILKREIADSSPDFKMPLPDSELPFMHIRKLHLLHKEPYSLVDLYLPKAVYDQLPAESNDQKRLYGQLIRDYANMQQLEGHQMITIVLATHELSELLEVPFASSIARIDSKLESNDGRQVMSYRAYIRGDLFMLQRRTGDILRKDPMEWRPTAP